MSRGALIHCRLIAWLAWLWLKREPGNTLLYRYRRYRLRLGSFLVGGIALFKGTLRAFVYVSLFGAQSLSQALKSLTPLGEANGTTFIRNASPDLWVHKGFASSPKKIARPPLGTPTFSNTQWKRRDFHPLCRR